MTRKSHLEPMSVMECLELETLGSYHKFYVKAGVCDLCGMSRISAYSAILSSGNFEVCNMDPSTRLSDK